MNNQDVGQANAHHSLTCSLTDNLDWADVEYQLGLSYSVVTLIGVGGFGRAYSGRDISGAWKVIKLSSDNDSSLSDEFNYLAALRHPNLVSVYKSFTVYGISYFVQRARARCGMDSNSFEHA